MHRGNPSICFVLQQTARLQELCGNSELLSLMHRMKIMAAPLDPGYSLLELKTLLVRGRSH